jgi:tyrosinase
MPISRRQFLASTAASSMLSLAPGLSFGNRTAAGGATARYHRCNVTSAEGQRMLASYARGVQAMLALPADHPNNWFRNAFIHMMDCPHGNWWFYVWHRGYVGYFEQIIRKLSGDAEFAMPYWDWTELPEIPAGMFDGLLTPTAAGFATYTGNMASFTSFAKPGLSNYWDTLSPAQRSQLQARGYPAFDNLWDDVIGYSPAQQAGISGNIAYAIACGARYLSKANPQLDAKTKADVAAHVILAGLLPVDFYNDQISKSFTSSRTTSHVIQPGGTTRFSILEGLPHNKVHNCIGGVGAVDPGPYGNMTNFLSPVDPVFFLHHSNMDRLWDVWTRKQQALGLPILPTGTDLETFMAEPFLFYADASGQYVGPRKAGDFVDTRVFDYDYVGGFDAAVGAVANRRDKAARPPAIKASLDQHGARVVVPNTLIRQHLDKQVAQPLVIEVTLQRPQGVANAREFDVLVNAPDGVDRVDADSPYYAGTVAFFGPLMPGMNMAHPATFAIPLPQTLRAFSKLQDEKTELRIRLVPSNGPAKAAPALSGAAIVPAG